jgi:hypothetical protein
MTAQRFRLVTRSDFDGLICAVLFRSLDMIDEITFVHPKDVQDGVVEITGRDIIANLPHDPRARLVFDHHHSETLRMNGIADNHVIVETAPSTARLVHDYFGGAVAFPDITEDAMYAVDQADSASYLLSDILQPRGWTLLNFVLDSRTGLGRFRDFHLSHHHLMTELIDEILQHHDIDRILTLPDVVERVTL